MTGKKIHVSVILILTTFCLAQLAMAQDTPSAGRNYTTVTDISFKSDANIDEYAQERCRLDIYYPSNTNNFATVVWFHGGGLTGGNRSIPAKLKNNGIAVVAAGYRLSPRAKSPAYIEDAAAAVAWAFQNIEKYGGSNKRIFISGHSAGGYLTSMIGLDKRWLAVHNIDADRIAGLIPFSGQCITHFTIRAERGINDKQPVIDDLAPLYHVRKEAPPMLLITGGRDMELLGRYEENAYLWRMMKEVGHPDIQLFELDGFNHGQMDEPAYPLLVRFIRKQLVSATAGNNAKATESSLPLSKNQELLAFLNCQLIPRIGNAWDYTFAPGKFPGVEWDRPELVQKVMGDFPLKIRWFDSRGKEVTSAEQPGRYAFYAEGTTTSGRIIRRGSTLFCRPKDWDGWSEKPKAYLDYLPLDGLNRSSWDSHREAIAGFAGRTVLLSILRQHEGALLMSYLHEIKNTGGQPTLVDTPLIRDHEYHLALKRKILNLEQRFQPFLLPQQIKENSAPMLHNGSEMEAGFKSGTIANLQEICKSWFEQSHEPFNLVVARKGVMIINESFGKWEWGEMTRETPTEMASLTKLITGVLFAQFVDQGLIGIDDPVGKFFPDFPTTGNNVLTLRHCFTHATSLNGHEEWGGMHNPWLENVIANASEFLLPGQVHNYNGMGYDLAGKVMEIVSGKSIFRLMRENLFDPLEMTHTTLEEDLGFSCFSTAADFAKIGQLLLNRGACGSYRFFSPQTFEKIMPQPLNRFYPALKQEWGIGITWMRQPHPQAGTNTIPKGQFVLSRNTIGHGSATSAILRVDLDNQVVIAQTRRRGGSEYNQHLSELLLAIEAGLK